MAGVKPIGGIDVWDVAVRTYALNYPNARTYQRRIANLSAKQVADEVGTIDLLLASPECTNHSVAKGNGARCEESRRTAYEVIRFAKAFQPRWVVVENVVAMQRWPSYTDWLKKLKRLGYQTAELKLDAQDFGVAQSRRRLFVVGDLKREPRIPITPGLSTATAKSILQRHSTNGYNYKLSPLFQAARAKPTIERARRAIKTLGSGKPFLIVYYGSDAAGGWQTLNRPLRTITTLDRFALVRPQQRGYVMRMLQPPELAAAMGFPDDYLWASTSRREHIKLIGNAVCPPVMKSMIESLVS
jgi:DNA (cytosine-5)-methyltransferase 1